MRPNLKQPLFAMLSLGHRMRHHYLICITLLALCHPQLRGQGLTNALPPTQSVATEATVAASDDSSLPDDPGQEALPVAQLEAVPQAGTPIQVEAQRQSRSGDVWTVSGEVTVHYLNYILHADKVVYHQSTSVMEAEGHLQLAGGPQDISLNADRGEMNLDAHTARFYNVRGSLGVHRTGTRTAVYTTANPFLFSGRVLLQTGEGEYRIIGGSMTNCNLPHPDWEILSRNIKLSGGRASTNNSVFKFLHVPLFYLPYLSHPTDENGRQSGLLLPIISNSSIKGLILGGQLYWVINRSMDMVIGSEYFSHRGWAPNGDFRYKGAGIDHLQARWNALLDRGITEQVSPTTTVRVNQGGIDITAFGRKDFSPYTRVAGNVDYLSSYVYRLVFNDNYSQAVSSQVASEIAFTHARNGYIPSVAMQRFQTFSSTVRGDEARISHFPGIRYDVLDRPLAASNLYWGFGSSVAFMDRSEPFFHARNIGRLDIYPHLSLPFDADGWSIVPQVAFRETFYSISQNPDYRNRQGGTPFLSHDPLNRTDLEASIDIRPPALERDFTLGRWNRKLRHVIEPEISYNFIGGIGTKARHTLMVDTTDIATDTNEVELSITQRFYLRPLHLQPCAADEDQSPKNCTNQPREWASWQVAEKFFFDPYFGKSLIQNRSNVFSTTLDLTAVAFLTNPRNLSPIISRMRFEAIPNLRVEWDMDYDPKNGRLDSDNLYAGYSLGRTTVGLGHALLNAVDENGTSASIIHSKIVQPFLSIGKQNGAGFNFAANGGYDFVLNTVQYAGVQAVYNWNCCGITVGYRRFELGSVRDETQWLYSFTLANFGSVGDVRRSNTVFRDPSLPPAY